MNKIYFTDVRSRYEARKFIDWLLAIPVPCEICLNGGVHYKFEDDTDKLYFLTALEAILNLDT